MNDAQNENDHIEMWKHYDNLRWQKNTAFLTANSIFVAILALKAQNLSKEVIGALSFLGVWIAIAWFLLLTRNGQYIKLHRKKDDSWQLKSWTPPWTPPSGVLDRALPVAFLIFWIVLLLTGDSLSQPRTGNATNNQISHLR